MKAIDLFRKMLLLDLRISRNVSKIGMADYELPLDHFQLIGARHELSEKIISILEEIDQDIDLTDFQIATIEVLNDLDKSQAVL